MINRESYCDYYISDTELEQARERVHDLSVRQHELRVEHLRLMGLDPLNPRLKELRGEMMGNRLGRDGLRACNTTLYCRGR